ncbi:MAG: integration host factor subunit beta [Kofleriaceae bacterium]|nr:integration host factor subunit beta [Kofleriaceae bacterium]
MSGTVTKSELIEHISEQLKLPTGKAEQIVNCVFDSMVKALQDGDGIEIRGFGSFTVRDYKAYEGRNPRTGATVQVAPKRLPFFKVGKDLRERVNRSAHTPPPDKVIPNMAPGTGPAPASALPTGAQAVGAQPSAAQPSNANPSNAQSTTPGQAPGTGGYGSGGGFNGNGSGSVF